jgi:hypothetical protein
MNKQFNPSQKVREAKIIGSTRFIGINLCPHERWLEDGSMLIE